MKARLRDWYERLIALILRVDDWLLGLAGAIVVAWVRRTRSGSAILLYLFGVLAVIAAVGSVVLAVIARNDSATVVGVLATGVIVAGIEVRGRGHDTALAAVPEFRAALIGTMLAVVLLATATNVLAFFAGVITAVDIALWATQLLYAVTVYIARIPPLDPPPPPVRRALARA